MTILKKVRAVLELAVPVWQPAITAQEKAQIERVQKCALHIILGENYTTYTDALKLMGCENLEERRIKLCEKFVKKASKHQKYQNWFHRDNYAPPKVNTRAKKSKYQYLQVKTRTERYKRSALPELLNNTTTYSPLINKQFIIILLLLFVQNYFLSILGY